jgi:hypothetical protein
MDSADKKAAGLAGYVECYLQREGQTYCSMTDATEAIWGTSGRGNPNAVRLIEAVATLGFLKIQQVGKRRRLVSRTDKVIPEEAFTAEDRKWALEL